MNCRQCGAPIPNSYLRLESFNCPECGKYYQKRRQAPQGNARSASTYPRSTPRRVVRRPGSRRSVGSFIKSRNILLLIALIIALIYFIAQVGNVTSGANKVANMNTDTMEQAGEAIGTAIGITMLMPHVILVALGIIFNAVGWFGRTRWAALTAAILYTVGGVLGLVNVLFLLAPMVLCYIASSQMKREQ